MYTIHNTNFKHTSSTKHLPHTLNYNVRQGSFVGVAHLESIQYKMIIYTFLPPPQAQSTGPWSFPGLRPGVPYNANNSQPDIKWQSFCVAQSQMFTVYSFVSCWDFCCCHYFPCWFIIFLSLLYLAYIQWLKQPMCHSQFCVGGSLCPTRLAQLVLCLTLTPS